MRYFGQLDARNHATETESNTAASRCRSNASGSREGAPINAGADLPSSRAGKVPSLVTDACGGGVPEVVKAIAFPAGLHTA